MAKRPLSLEYEEILDLAIAKAQDLLCSSNIYEFCLNISKSKQLLAQYEKSNLVTFNTFSQFIVDFCGIAGNDVNQQYGGITLSHILAYHKKIDHFNLLLRLGAISNIVAYYPETSNNFDSKILKECAWQTALDLLPQNIYPRTFRVIEQDDGTQTLLIQIKEITKYNQEVIDVQPSINNKDDTITSIALKRVAELSATGLTLETQDNDTSIVKNNLTNPQPLNIQVPVGNISSKELVSQVIEEKFTKLMQKFQGLKPSFISSICNASTSNYRLKVKNFLVQDETLKVLQAIETLGNKMSFSNISSILHNAQTVRHIDNFFRSILVTDKQKQYVQNKEGNFIVRPELKTLLEYITSFSKIVAISIKYLPSKKHIPNFIDDLCKVFSGSEENIKKQVVDLPLILNNNYKISFNNSKPLMNNIKKYIDFPMPSLIDEDPVERQFTELTQTIKGLKPTFVTSISRWHNTQLKLKKFLIQDETLKVLKAVETLREKMPFSSISHLFQKGGIKGVEILENQFFKIILLTNPQGEYEQDRNGNFIVRPELQTLLKVTSFSKIAAIRLNCLSIEKIPDLISDLCKIFSGNKDDIIERLENVLENQYNISEPATTPLITAIKQHLPYIYPSLIDYNAINCSSSVKEKVATSGSPIPEELPSKFPELTQESSLILTAKNNEKIFVPTQPNLEIVPSNDCRELVGEETLYDD